MRKMKEEITNFKFLDVDDIGFADVKLYKRIENGSIPNEILSNAKTAIVYTDRLEKLDKYGRWYIVSLINYQSRINKKLIKFLNGKGYDAIGISDNEYDRKTLVGKLSFRQLAVLAGLGSIGKNQMLIHPKFGPKVILGVVLTNAEIGANSFKKQNLCTKCGVCIKSCPIKALNNGYDRLKCKNRRKILGKGCGTPCINLCPIGK